MLEVNRLAGKSLPVDGGFDDEGNYTRDPATLEQNRRILPMGYWKGSALSVVLDMLATLLSNGASVTEVTHDNGDEFGISQVFIAIDVDRLSTVKPASTSSTASGHRLSTLNGPTSRRPFACPAISFRRCGLKISDLAFR